MPKVLAQPQCITMRPPQVQVAVRALAMLIALLLLAPLAALAAELPALTGRVVDNAGIIDAATRAELEAKLAQFQQKSSDQIVVATIPALDGEPIENYANKLFRAWGLGQAGENNGTLLLVARDDRQMRIEVGYGLEGTLTDLHSSLIIRNTMVPAFRAGDFSGGISRAVDDIIMVLEGNAAELEARAKRNPQSSDDEVPFEVMIFFAIWATIFFGAFAMAILPRIFGQKLAPGRYRWLGMDFSYNTNTSGRARRGGVAGGVGGGMGGGWSSGGGGWSSGGGGFSGGGGSSGGGGASGGW